MDFLVGLINKHKSKVEEREATCNNHIARITDAISEVSCLFEGNSKFVEPMMVVNWLSNNQTMFDELQRIGKLRTASKYRRLEELQREIQHWKNNVRQRTWEHNTRVAAAKIAEAYELIGNVEGRSLDIQQMSCVVKEVNNHLVIAGAGTGKTTTIVGKIKYLLKTKAVQPEDILVLSFTNASAAEMNERIKREVEQNIEASTFHKLGLNIIKQVNGITPKIASLKMQEFIRTQISQNITNPEYLRLLSTYLLFNRVVGKSEFDFKSEKEYEEYKRINPPTTLKGELVKSYGELDIANFLLKSGIEYIYEAPYEIDTRTGEHVQYRPDFYLPEYGIYIEYFGINRNGQVPAYFQGTAEKTASEKYQETIQWKRDIHKKYQTTLIECYSYEKWEGKLLEKLETCLAQKAVNFAAKSATELWEQIVKEDNAVIDGLVELFLTVINLIKSNAYTVDIVRQKNRGGNWGNNNLLLNLIEPVYDAYCLYLQENDEIDFNDMINQATQYVREGKYKNSYKYVIVDEYQDISKARFSLLEALRKSEFFQLFCVGDDWQSIYRFAGSDISFILEFEKYWGASEISKIETTYRFQQSLIDISGNFIMCNPKQIKKKIKGNSENGSFALGEIKGYADRYAVDFMCKKMDGLPPNSSVFLIGRYSFDVKILQFAVDYDYWYDNVNARVAVRYNRRQDLNICFLTAHKSKGLQADYVFILNNKKGKMGFPSKMQDAPILELLLDNSDTYPLAEERRLFYVALTRARKKVYLLTVDGKESDFAIELRRKYDKELRGEKFVCPLCGGRLYKKSGKNGEFYGCENYKSKGCRYTRSI